MRHIWAALGLVLGLLALRPADAAADQITVFAAASLTDALNAVDDAYTAKTGIPVAVSFASSSTLARQIEAGAPAQIFISADLNWMDYLDQKGLVESATRTNVLGNALALVAPADSALGPRAIGREFDWQKALGPDGRIAVGDPAHVPAGLYAKEALTNLGVWSSLEPRLARAEDVRGAVALVERGEAPLGIVYVTDARVTPNIKIVAIFPAWSHEPIIYPFAVVKGAATPAVLAYFRFLGGPEARTVYRRFGFATP